MNNYFKIIDNFLSPEHCQSLINFSEKIGYTPADISFPKAQGGPRMIPTYRNNDRVLHQSDVLRKLIETKLAARNSIPTTYTRQLTNTETATLKFVEVSDRFRFYRYGPGHFFKKHRDNSEQLENGISCITILIYLNTVKDSGYTNLIDNLLPNKIGVQPVTGRLLMFDHCILHEGEELIEGDKYLIRTDLIYK